MTFSIIFNFCIWFLGGLALFMLGINWMAKGLQKTAGEKLRTAVYELSKNKTRGFFTGIVTAFIVQSSGSTAAMLVNFVNAGLLDFSSTFTILLGASIGATITAQLIAFKITQYALLIIIVGTIFYFFSKQKSVKGIGETILGIGFLFFGLLTMNEAIIPLEKNAEFIQLVATINSPYKGILFAMIITMLIQSSGAFIGIIMVLAMHNLLTLDVSIGMVIGTNIGTAITPFFASLNTQRDAKKVAFALITIKLIGLIFFIGWIPQFAALIKNITYTNTITTYASPREIANAHTIFNISVGLILLPFSSYITRLINKFFPTIIYSEEQKIYQLKYLNNSLINTPEIALNLALQESERLCKNVNNNLNELPIIFLDKNDAVKTQIEIRRKKTVYLHNKIQNYLILICKEDLSSTSLKEAFKHLYIINEVIKISDIYYQLVEQECDNWIKLPLHFSLDGQLEIKEFHEYTMSHFSHALSAFVSKDMHIIQKTRQEFKEHRMQLKKYEVNHFKRLINENKDSELTSKLHLKILQSLTMINEHTNNIGRVLLDGDQLIKQHQ